MDEADHITPWRSKWWSFAIEQKASGAKHAFHRHTPWWNGEVALGHRGQCWEGMAMSSPKVQCSLVSFSLPEKRLSLGQEEYLKNELRHLLVPLLIIAGASHFLPHLHRSHPSTRTATRTTISSHLISNPKHCWTESEKWNICIRQIAVKIKNKKR